MLVRWVVVCVVGLGLVFAAGGEFDLQGHRGCRGLLPENTMPAFKRALELGVTTLEFDLQVTRDRVLIVTHDQHLDPAHCRYDDGRKVAKTPFKDVDYPDLKAVECGSRQAAGFPQQQTVPDARIPTFVQVLELARDADYPVRVSAEI